MHKVYVPHSKRKRGVASTKCITRTDHIPQGRDQHSQDYDFIEEVKVPQVSNNLNGQFDEEESRHQRQLSGMDGQALTEKLT